jgi:hypothetical protein
MSVRRVNPWYLCPLFLNGAFKASANRSGQTNRAPVADNQSHQNLLSRSIIGAGLADLETTRTYGKHSILDRRETHARGVVVTPGAKP